MKRIEFISMATAAAEKAAKVGAPINPPIVVAQAAIESGFGTSRLAKSGKNLFGVRAGEDWSGKTITFRSREFIPGAGWRVVVERYRDYPNFVECFEDYGRVLGATPEGRKASRDHKDPGAFLTGLVDSLRGEDPTYAARIWTAALYWGLIPRSLKMPAVVHAFG